MPRHLFGAWPQVARRFRAAERWLLLLDFDGTLAPLTSDPQAARLGSAVRRILVRLASRRNTRVCVISGRPLDYLQKEVNVPGVRLLGLHGWQRQGASLRPPERGWLLATKHWLEPRLLSAPGVKLEDKGYVLAIHYREAGLREAKLAREMISQVLHRLEPGVHLLEGNMIWELLPSFIEGKGAAARRLLAKLSGRWLPVYAGDDKSDESVFATLRRGVTIQVGGRNSTRAGFRLRDPAEVREFLERLEALDQASHS
jgi:trehalose-phosphatase